MRSLRPSIDVLDVVMTGKDAALEAYWAPYSDDDRSRAAELLNELGVGHLRTASFATASEGERQQVLLARALMAKPQLLLLDEPYAGLDLGARERLLGRI